MLVILFLLCLASNTLCARIFCIMPLPFYAHQITFQPLWKELSLKGHHVTLVTTHPIGDKSLVNLTEINIKHIYGDKMERLVDVASDVGLLEAAKQFITLIKNIVETIFSMGEIQELTSKGSYDLVIFEAMDPFPVYFSKIFNCPAIGVNSFELPVLYHFKLRNPVHSVVNFQLNVGVVDHKFLTFFERINSLVYELVFTFLTDYIVLPMYETTMQKYIKNDDLDSTRSIQNMSLILTCTNAIFQNALIESSNIVNIGGNLHLSPGKPLARDLQEYLDSSKNGVIYFSLGSNVKGHLLNDTIKRNILQAFSELPYNVLMKMDTDLKDVPKNVKIQKWLPQQDVLRHPNIKLFISQGGLQSLQESITNGIPLVGIPFFGDQISNVYRMVKKGYGVRVDKNEITKENFKQAILEVLNNPRYREKAKEMGELLHDEPMTSLEKAVWWIEYVIRHKGAKHLRSPAVDMPAWKYYMLDVIGSVLGALFIVLFLSYKILKCVISKLLFGKPKAKKD